MIEIDSPARRPLRWWDIGVSATVVVMAAVGALELASDAASVGPADVAVTLGWLVVFGVWYVVLGRSALRRATLDEPPRPVDFLFLVGLVAIIGVATAALANFATLQAVGYPIIWTVVSRYRSAIAWSGALAVAVGLGFLSTFTRYGVDGGVAVALTIAVISFAFAVAMGTWIMRIFDQGQRYRALAEELRRSQAEVSALSESAGAAAERERLSRELHDTLTQTLTGLVMLSEQAERALDAGDTARAADRVARVGAAAREAVSEARVLVATTQPLGDGGLEAAIERLVSRLRGDTGLRVECEVAVPPLDRERQVVLLRAAQEGLANARKHARASRIALSLRGAPDGGAVLLVEDDGIGPAGVDPSREAGASGGYGLTGLADRVRAVGGDVRFGPGPQGGSRLEIRLAPVRADAGVGAGSRAGAGAGSCAAPGAGAGAVPEADAEADAEAKGGAA